MRAEADRIYACLACASGFGDEKVCVIWNAARDFFSESVMEARLRAILLANKFALRQMYDDLLLSDGSGGGREDCPKEDHTVMKILSRLIRECLADFDNPWGDRSGLGWADLTDMVRELLATQGNEVIWALALAEDLGL